MFGPFKTKVRFPLVELWRRKGVPKLRIINPGDFPLRDILEGLGLNQSPLTDSFGVSDAGEIKERQALMRLALNDPLLVKNVKDAGVGGGIPIPTSQQQRFLDYYDPKRPHNPFWNMVHTMLQRLEGRALSTRLQQAVTVLKANLFLEDKEKQMADRIADRLQNIAVIEGLADIALRRHSNGPDPKLQEQYERTKEGEAPPNRFSVYGSVIKFDYFGHQMFSYGLSAARKIRYPRWTDGSKWNPGFWLGIAWLTEKIVDFRNWLIQRAAHHAMVIQNSGGLTEADKDYLMKDVASGLASLLNRLDLAKAGFLEGAVAKVHFSYSEAGLRLNIYGLAPNWDEEDAQGDFTFGSYPGYSRARISQIEKARKRYQRETHTFRLSVEAAALARKLATLSGKDDFLCQVFAVDSPHTNERHRWAALENLYQQAEIEGVYKELGEFRAFFSSVLDQLELVFEVGNQLREKTKELGVGLSFPEVIEDEGQHVVAFDSIVPVHLTMQLEKQGKKAVPVTGLAALNGQLIGITGRHGGGKTVAELSVVEQIYLAQSGLPVFGSGFRLNVKEILGVCFIERGEGSTIQMLLQKTKNILEGIKGMDGRKVVLVLDELGSATQEEAGLDFSIDLLRKLRRSGVSVMFSTQIQPLARYAMDTLGADMYRVDKEHHLHSGIGDGELKSLTREMGLDKLMK